MFFVLSYFIFEAPKEDTDEDESSSDEDEDDDDEDDEDEDDDDEDDEEEEGKKRMWYPLRATLEARKLLMTRKQDLHQDPMGIGPKKLSRKKPVRVSRRGKSLQRRTSRSKAKASSERSVLLQEMMLLLEHRKIQSKSEQRWIQKHPKVNIERLFRPNEGCEQQSLLRS